MKVILETIQEVVELQDIKRKGSLVFERIPLAKRKVLDNLEKAGLILLVGTYPSELMISQLGRETLERYLPISLDNLGNIRENSDWANIARGR